MDKLRAYIWTHASLGLVDRSVQTGHCIGELSQNTTGKEYFNQWASQDKTLILLNPGRSKGLRQIAQTIMTALSGTKCPTGIMIEDEDTMEGMTTSFGVIVPERYIIAAKGLKLYEGSYRSRQIEKLTEDLWSELRPLCKPIDIFNALNTIIESQKAI